MSLRQLILRTNSFFINDLGQIRMIDAPDVEYLFRATNNERVNEMRREAMQGKVTSLLSYHFTHMAQNVRDKRQKSVCQPWASTASISQTSPLQSPAARTSRSWRLLQRSSRRASVSSCLSTMTSKI
jgi:hypothetical protein